MGKFHACRLEEGWQAHTPNLMEGNSGPRYWSAKWKVEIRADTLAELDLLDVIAHPDTEAILEFDDVVE